MIRKIENAKIIRTRLGYEHHDILSSYLILDYDGSGQGFGGWALGDEFLDVWIRGILKVLKFEKWEDLVGVYVKVDHDDTKVYGIAHITGNEWFYPEEEFKRVKE